MNMLPFYMFLEATGTMAIYQANMQYWSTVMKAFQPKVSRS